MGSFVMGCYIGAAEAEYTLTVVVQDVRKVDNDIFIISRLSKSRRITSLLMTWNWGVSPMSRGCILRVGGPHNPFKGVEGILKFDVGVHCLSSTARFMHIYFTHCWNLNPDSNNSKELVEANILFSRNL